MVLKIGITGGIGSGKTTVCKLFEELGIPVYYADTQAKYLMSNDEKLIAQIKELFGEEAYHYTGLLNRAHIAKIAFSDQSKLEQLNRLVHPAVATDSLAWHNAQQEVPYTLKEAALLYESGSYKALDKIITVTAPEAIRIERVMKRDQVEEAAVRARMEKQLPETYKVEQADFVIHNDGTQSLITQVLAIHQQLLALTAKLNGDHDKV
ncbi:MAG: dephospho-CoA kinase [Bacteroidota bacterium]